VISQRRAVPAAAGVPAGQLERALPAVARDTGPLDAAIERAGAMDAFPEADAALGLLREAGLPTGVLTNRTADAAERALMSAGLRDSFELVIGGDAVQTFKPDPRVYAHAAERVNTDRAEIVLVAAHARDVMGAMRAGLKGAGVARSERWLVPVVPEPDVRCEDLDDVARRLLAHAD
jgi:2-haloacid dehalogenase